MKYLIVICLLLSTTFSSAQNHVLSGTVQSATDESTFPGATVMVANPKDSSLIKGTVTDFNGQFRLGDLKNGVYLLQINFVGFRSHFQQVNFQKSMDLGAIQLMEDTQELAAVEIVGKPVAAMQKGDTSQFSAKAYKTAPDASSQELIEKLPGITSVDGKLQANGEDVQLILLDGKPFFGGSVSDALQNLPADVVAEVQIFDKKSDKAALSGFDDGNQQKTINIITKPSRRVGQFGKSTVGAGTNGTYQAAASVNFFNDDQRITFTGLSNNTNLVNYSADPNSLGDARTQNGLIRTNNAGLNFSDNLGDKVELNGNYQFFWRENEERNELTREYASATDSGQVYREDSYNNRVNAQHRLSMKLEYKINKNNTLLMRPNLSFRHEKTNNDFMGETTSLSSLINSTDNNATGRYKDYDYDNNLFYSHKFAKTGRSFTARIHTGWHTNEDLSKRLARNVYYTRADSLDLLDQQTTRTRTGISWETQFSYTEPVGEHSIMELEYEIGDRINDSDQRLYENSGEVYDLLDTALSNTFENSYLRQKTELGYQYSLEKWSLQMELQHQSAHMRNDQEFPFQLNQDRTFYSVLPSVRFDYRFNENQRVQLRYNTWTNEPSIGDLQDVINNSNPLQLRIGNPDLNQTYTHRMRARMWSSNMETGKSFYGMIESRFANNLITNSTFTATEPSEIADGVILEAGSRLTKPINVDGYYQLRTYASFGQPIELIKSNIRFNGGLTMTQRPGFVNDQINFSNAKNYNLGLSLSSNVSEKLDFNLSTRSDFNMVENSLRPSLNNNFYVHTTSLKYRWVFWDGIVYRMDMRHQLNTGLSAGFDNSYLLMNMSAGKKFLKNNLAEISINVYDLFEQNNNVNRAVNELYIEDRQSTVLERYFMLAFTYNIRHFSAGTTMEDFEDI